MSDRRDKCLAAIERRRQMGEPGDLRAVAQLEEELARIDAEDRMAAADALFGITKTPEPAAAYRTKHYATEAEWKADHRYMSGSRIAKVVGLSQWGGPLTAYLECTDPQDIEINEPIEAGRRLETAVAEWAADVYGLGECRMNGRAVVIHPEHDFIRATADAWTDQGGLEIKTSSQNEWPDTGGELVTWEPEEETGLPSDVWCQVLLTMAITGAAHWYVAVLRWGRDLRVYKVPASPKLQAWLVDESVTFWREHVEPRLAPAPTKADAQPGQSGLLTQRLYPRADKGSALDVNDDLTATWARAWVEASKLEKKAATAKELAALQMTQHMAEHETLYVCGNKFTWKTNKLGNRRFRGPADWKDKDQNK